MGLIQDQPEDLPTTDALADVEDPDDEQRDEVRTEVYMSGAHVCTLDYAPRGLERMQLMSDVEVYEAGGVRFTGENGETQVPICKVRRIGDMYPPGTQRPPSKDEIKAMQAAAKAKAALEAAEREEAERAEAEHNEPPMFDEDGNPMSDDAPRPVVDGEVDGDPPPPVGPAFSDGATS